MFERKLFIGRNPVAPSLAASRGLTTTGSTAAPPPRPRQVYPKHSTSLAHEPNTQTQGLDSVTVRHKMVAQIGKDPSMDPRVLAVLATVERHRFVDAALVAQAYEDTSLPIGHEQTISKPSVVARMLSLMLGARVFALQAHHSNPPPLRVLEIGTGCGYQAALLAHLMQALKSETPAKNGGAGAATAKNYQGEVYSIERITALHELARRNVLAKTSGHALHNLHLIKGDGMLGYAAGAPYAAIVSAAGGVLPAAWEQQLAMGGRIVAPFEHTDAAGKRLQSLMVWDKTPQGMVATQHETVQFVPLQSGVVGR